MLGRIGNFNSLEVIWGSSGALGQAAVHFKFVTFVYKGGFNVYTIGDASRWGVLSAEIVTDLTTYAGLSGIILGTLTVCTNSFKTC